jgi:hypothetical protein
MLRSQCLTHNIIIPHKVMTSNDKEKYGETKEKKNTSLQHEQRDTHCTSTAALFRSIAGEEGAANKQSSLRERWTLALHSCLP